MWMDSIYFILAFGAIAFLTYVASKYFAGKTKRAMSGKYINIIETVSLGLDKHIHLVRVEDQFVLIASTAKTIEFLTNVKIEGFEEKEPLSSNTGNVFDFKSLFEKYVNSYKGKRSGKGSSKENIFASSKSESTEMPEENVFKSNLNKMKEITGVMYKRGNEDGDGS